MNFERAHVDGGEETNALAVGAAPLPEEEQGAQPQRPEQEAPSTLGLPHAAVLRQEAQVAAEVLDVHPAAVGGATDVDDLRAGIEPDVPPGSPEAEHPVRLLAEHEEVLVEEADGVGGLAPHEQRRAGDPVDFAGLVVVEAAGVERVQELRARSELADEEVLRGEAPDRRETARRALERPVGVHEPRPDDRRLGMLVGEGDQLLDRVAGHPGVGVEQEEVAAPRDAHAGVVARAHAQVVLLDEPRVRKALAHELAAPVGRAVVDHDRLVAGDGLEAALEPGQWRFATITTTTETSSGIRDRGGRTTKAFPEDHAQPGQRQQHRHHEEQEPVAKLRRRRRRSGRGS